MPLRSKCFIYDQESQINLKTECTFSAKHKRSYIFLKMNLIH